MGRAFSETLEGMSGLPSRFDPAIASTNQPLEKTPVEKMRTSPLPTSREELARAEPDFRIASMIRKANADTPLWLVAADAEIAKRQKQGLDLSDDTRLSIIEAYSKAYTGKTVDTRLTPEEIRLKDQERRGFVENALRSFGAGIADVGTGLVGSVAPELANNFKQNTDAYFDPTVSESLSKDFKNGNLIGSSLAFAAYLPTAIVAPASVLGIFGISVGGSVRQDVAQRRTKGEDISAIQEWSSAVASGTAEAVFESIGIGALTSRFVNTFGGRLTQRIAKAISSENPSAIRSIISETVAASGVNATEEFLTQVAQNAASRIYSDTGIFDDVIRAAVSGGLGGSIVSAPLSVAGLRQRQAALAKSNEPIEGVDLSNLTNPPETTLATDFSDPEFFSSEGEIDFSKVPNTAENRAKLGTAIATVGRTLTPEEAIAAGPDGPISIQEETTPVQTESPQRTRDEIRREREARLDAEIAARLNRPEPVPPEAIPPGVPVIRRSTEAKLSPRAQQAFDRLAGSGDAKAVGRPVAPRTELEQQAVELGRKVGVEVVLLEGASFRGVTENVDGESGIVFASAGRPAEVFRETIAHEVAHAAGIDLTTPLDKRIVAKAAKRYQTQILEPAVRAGAISQSVLDGFKNSPVQQQKEGVALLVGEVLKDPTQFNTLLGVSPTLSQKFRSAIVQTLKRLTGAAPSRGVARAVLAEFQSAIEQNRPTEIGEDGTVGRENIERAEALFAQQQQGVAADSAIVRRSLTPRAQQESVFRSTTPDFLPDSERPARIQAIRERIAFLRGSQRFSETKPHTEEIARLNDELKAVKDGAKKNFVPKPSPILRDMARQYVSQNTDVAFTPVTKYEKVVPQRAVAIAKVYAVLKHDPTNPDVVASYDAFKDETRKQFEFLRERFDIEPFVGEGQPYATSQEMFDDLEQNRHLSVFTGGELPADHPLAEQSGVEINGQPLTYNDLFLAVHDVFGHAREGFGFGPRGEENAYISHSRMFSPLARKAMTTETRGQNSWVNYGPFGKQNRANPANTIFAEQKAGLLPERFITIPEDASTVSLRTVAPLNAGPDLFGSPPESARVLEVAALLNENTKRILGPAPKADSAKVERFVRVAATELAHQLTQPVTGVGWYERMIDNTRSHLMELGHSELLSDEPWTTFAVLLGNTSPGNKVFANMRAAEAIYRGWKRTGRFPVRQRNGLQWPGTLAVEDLQKRHDWMESFIESQGPGAMREWLLTPHSVRELREQGLSQVSGRATDLKEGFHVFGPKIGPFIGGLLGSKTQVIKDRWFNRTWNRIMGSLIESGSLVDEPRNDSERDIMDQAIQELSGVAGLDAPDVQAVLWFYEKGLYGDHGVTRGAELGAYDAAARRLIEEGVFDDTRKTTGGKGSVDPASGVSSETAGQTADRPVFETDPSEIEFDLPSFLPDEPATLTNGWIKPDGTFIEVPVHRHSAILGQIPHDDPIRGLANEGAAFEDLYSRGWVRVQTDRFAAGVGGKAFNIALHKLNQGTLRRIEELSDRAFARGIQLKFLLSRPNGRGADFLTVEEPRDLKRIQRQLLEGGVTPNFLPEPAEVVRSLGVDPESPSFGQKLKASLASKSPDGPFQLTALDKVKKGVKDSLWPLVKAMNEAVSRQEANGVKVKPSENATLLLRNLGGNDKQVGGRLKRGLRTFRGVRILDPVSKQALNIDWLLQPYARDTKEATFKAVDLAMSLGVAQRTVEKAKFLGREDDLTGFKKGTNKATDLAAANAFIAEVEASPEATSIKEGLRRYRLFADQTLKAGLDSGYLSKDDVKRIRDANEFYVNLQRIVGEDGKKAPSQTGPVELHEFRGSNRDIDNPLVNLLVTSESLGKAMKLNHAMAMFVKAAEATQSDDLAQRVDVASSDTIRVKIDGEDTFWRVHPEVKDTINAYGEAVPEFLAFGGLPIIGEFLPEGIARTGVGNLPGKLTRSGVTVAPPFLIRNLIRDSVDRAIKSDQGGLWSTFQGLNEKDLADFEEFGGSVGRREYGPARQDYFAQLRHHAANLSKDKNTILGIPSQIWGGYTRLQEASENHNRLVEFRLQKAKALKEGMSEYDANIFAASRARGLVDFAISGSIIKSINRVMYIPFLNAAIQGLGADINSTIANPKSVATRLVMYSVMPSLLAYAWAVSQGEDELKEYVELPAWRRDFFWNFKVGQMYMSIPKPFTFGMVGSGIERVVSASRGDHNAFRGLMGSLIRSTSPVDEFVIAGPFRTIVENMTNYSFFYDRNIVPVWEEGLALDLRNTEGASNLGQALTRAASAAGWEVDPRKWDNFLNGFGGTGQILKAVGDLPREEPGRGPGGLLQRTSGVTTVPPGFSSQSVQELQERARRAGDIQSPALQRTKELLIQGFQERDLTVRNELAREAREISSDEVDFLDRFGERILQFNAQRKRARNTPLEPRFDAISRRLRQLRKSRLTRPDTRDKIDGEIDRLLSLPTEVVR